jgi:O-antigen/teichoic acid export membrane protein
VGFRKLIVWIVSIVLGLVTAFVFFPTLNVAGGGGATMCAFIILTVIFRAAIEFLLNQMKRKN